MVATTLAAPTDNEIAFDETNTSWGNGRGTSGEVLSPENIDELGDLISSLEFKATLGSSNILLNSSSLDVSVVTQVNGTQVSNTSNLWNHWNPGISYTGQASYEEDGNYVIEYGENTKNIWGARDFVRSIANASSQDASTDINGYDGYVFIEPRNISLNGKISGGNSNVSRINPEFDDPDSDISKSAELTIGLTSDLISEIQNLNDNSTIDISGENIIAFGSTNGESEYTIKVADYVDSQGKINYQQLNSSANINLDFNVDFTDKTNAFTTLNGWANLQSNPKAFGNPSNINLRAGDHDSALASNGPPAMMVDGQNIDEIVESIDLENGTKGTRVEFVFDTNSISQAYQNLSDGESKISYTLQNGNINIDSFSSNHVNFTEALNNNGSLTSLILDFDGYTPKSFSADYDFTVRPISNIIDFAQLTPDQAYLDLTVEGLTDALFNVDYELTANGTNAGNVGMNAYENTLNGYSTTNLHGHINQQDLDFDSINAGLRNLNLNATRDGGGHENLSLQFSFNEETDSYQIQNASGSDWGKNLTWDTENYLSNLESLPEGIQFDLNDFKNMSFKNFDAAILDQNLPIALSTYLSSGDDGGGGGINPPEASIALNYNLYRQDAFLGYDSDDAINQLAVLGDSVNQDARFVLDINAQSLEDDFNIESADITIAFDPQLFGSINASDVKIGGELPLANAVHIDNEAGTIRLAASSLSNLDQGSGISDIGALASISLNFDESQIQYLEKNSDGSLKISPLTFDISVNEQETIFSNTFTDKTGLLNREILTLDDLGGGFAVAGQEVTLYEAQIKLEQQGDGLVLGTERVIGSDAAFTNLVRKGDTIATSTKWLNVGNIEASNLTYSEIYNENASLSIGSASFSETNIASGSFIEGEFWKAPRQSTIFTADIDITGDAGNVVDLSDGIVSVHAQGTSDVFTNEGLGSSNLITYQGDLNYDGRVSMKDLAYLNAGAARQQIAATGETIDASVARDVDADFSGKIDIADLAILDSDWGKSLHIGDEQFQGSTDVSWTALDTQGNNTTWNNDSFKDQNSIEAETSYIGSLESPAATGVIGADGNEGVDNNNIQGDAFQDPLAA